MSEHTRLSLPNLATVNDHQIERVIPTRRELILSNLLRAVAAITNFQPFAKLRIYLDTFDVASLLLILVYNTIVFFSLCNGGCLSNASQKLDDFGKSWGSLAQFNLMLILLPVSRRAIILPYLGIPTNRLIMFHKWLGRWIMVVLITHASLMSCYYAQQNQFWNEILKSEIIFGQLSALCILFLVLSSLKVVRRRLYDVFMKSHYIAFVLAFFFAFLHKDGSTLLLLSLFSIIVYCVDLMIRFYKLATSRHAVRYKLISPNFVELTIAEATNYKAGDYAYLWIPTISPIEMHPFSISSNPESGVMSFTIQAGGNWTKKLATNPVEYVWVDASYSALTIPLTLYPRLVMVAGGIGITPIISIIKSIKERNTKSPEKSAYVELVWSSRHLDLFSHFYSDLVDVTEDKLIRVHLYYTGKEDVRATIGDQCSIEFCNSIKISRVNVADLLDAYADKLTSRANVGVISCGTAELVGATARACSIPRKNCLYVHHTELFGL